jgi:olefin beta-lactone synthetase
MKPGRPPHDVLSPDGNLARFLHHQAQERADTPALVFPAGRGSGQAEEIVTFGALDRDGRRFAAALVDSGLVQGDRVLLLVPPSRALYVAMVGAVAAGAVAVFVDPSMGRAHIDAAIESVKPRVFIGVPRAHLLRLASRAARAIERRIVVGGSALLGERFEDVLARAPEPMPLAEVPGDAPCIISFTSGTTGAPKGAVRTHLLLATQGDALDRALPRTAGDVDLATLPLFALLAVSQGVPSVFADVDPADVSRFDPAVIVGQIERHRVTGIGGSPALLLRLARHLRATGQTVPRVRMVTLGGAPAAPHLLRLLIDAFPAASVHVLYGSTEAEPVASAEARELVALRGRGCCVGRPHEGLLVRVVRAGLPAGHAVGSIDEVTLATGEVGELVVSGPVVVERYMESRDTEATKLVDGEGRRWHRMGDLGRLDEDGRIWLHGRAGEAIETPRGALYPLDVEPLVETIEGVARAGLVGAAGRAALALVCAPGAPPARTIARVRAALAAEGLPIDDVFPIAEMPVDRRHRARIDRAALRAALPREARAR